MEIRVDGKYNAIIGAVVKDDGTEVRIEGPGSDLFKGLIYVCAQLLLKHIEVNEKLNEFDSLSPSYLDDIKPVLIDETAHFAAALNCELSKELAKDQLDRIMKEGTHEQKRDFALYLAEHIAEALRSDSDD